MSLKTFQTTKTHDFRVCGMIPKLAQTVRACIQQKDNTPLSQISQKILTKIQSLKNCGNLTFGLIVGGIAKDNYNDLNGTPDVVVFLISDPTDIDSKWLTFLSHSLNKDQTEEIYSTLYKYNPL